ncbi:hypothetical protein P3T76_009922 [Phytophthora citrophthora]|uniref:Uncharacterized protein n=1 Tax=Phytophthora citrophthora TaxID=4793 RepID=A0AAD9GES8_9STRA|nr:hypothetical protein P3T76_009922 [Phytophthora citrophthora]
MQNRMSLKASTGQRPKPRFTDSLIFVTLALVVVILLTCGFIIEARILARGPESIFFGIIDLSCSPDVVDLTNVKYHSDNEYYSKLREMTPLHTPVFVGNHTDLCKNRIHLKRKQLSFNKCLPISGREDPDICSGADRMDLLKKNSSGLTICRASILHLLLVEVYEELQALGKSPVILYGSLLGAVRDKGMIPYTEDADIGYSGRLRVGNDLQRLLWQKGYHLFFQQIWRVCVAPTHPLAVKMYDSSVSTSSDFVVPYLDLYYMNQRDKRSGAWKIEEMNKVNGSNLILADKVTPFSQVTINNQQFDTVHDTKYFLERMYGEDYMTPKPRHNMNQVTSLQGLKFYKTNRIEPEAPADGHNLREN